MVALFPWIPVQWILIFWVPFLNQCKVLSDSFRKYKEFSEWCLYEHPCVYSREAAEQHRINKIDYCSSGRFHSDQSHMEYAYLHRSKTDQCYYEKIYILYLEFRSSTNVQITTHRVAVPSLNAQHFNACII